MNKIKNYFSLFLFVFCLTKSLIAGYIGTHSINTDAALSDWTNQTGLHFLNENQSYITDNQYIWQDAYGDDTGDGDYIYPTSTNFNPHSADIDQFRVAWDTTNLYIFLRAYNATRRWWASAFIIGIDTGTPNAGNSVLIEGNKSDAETGPCAELKSTKIKCDFTIFGSSTYKCRIWNASGVKIGDEANTGDDGSLNNVYFKSPSWNEWKIKIPLSLLGASPTNSTWHYIVGIGHEDGNHFREIQPDNSGNPMEWYGIHGDNTWWETNGVDPDVFDLIGASSNQQAADLNSYNVNGTPGNTNDFADIQYSYVTVADYNKFYIQPASISAKRGDIIPITVLGANTVSTGEFLNTNYSITVSGGVGVVSNNKFYAVSSMTGSEISGNIIFSMTGVASYTLNVSVSSNVSTNIINSWKESDISVDLVKSFLDPADEKVTINIFSPNNNKVKITVFTITGEKIKSIEKNVYIGNNSIEWYKNTDNNNLVGSGLYMLRIEIDNYAVIKKVLIVE